METNSAQNIHYLACPVAQEFIDRQDDSVKLAIEIARKLQDGIYKTGEEDTPDTLGFGGYFADCSPLKDEDGYDDNKLLPPLFFIHCNRSPQYGGDAVFFVSKYPYDSGEEFENAIKEALPLRLP